jgi:hypothetical protein
MKHGQQPFADVRMLPDGFSLPELKWREMLFVGSLRPDGDAFVRDPARPQQPFAAGELFPLGVRFRVASREDGRVRIQRLPDGPV